MKHYSHYNKNLIVFVALSIIPLLGFGIDIYIPSLPAINMYYHTTTFVTQTTLTIYILGLGISQLIAGNIVDTYGRRNPLIVATIAYGILCLLITRTSSIDVFIYYRLLQGIAAGFAAVSARAVFSDLFQGKEYYQKATYITISYSLGPIVAPFIGGYLQHYFSWQANFYFLFIYCAVCFILVIFFFPETIQVYHQLNIKSISQKYYSMFSHVEFISGIICLSCMYALLMLFNLVGPFIVQVKLHYSPVSFGYVALFSGLCWFLGMITSRITIHWQMNKKLNVVTTIAVLDLLLMFALAHFWFNLYVIVIPIYILLFCCSIIFSSFFVRNPTYFSQYAATASAVTTGGFSLLSSWLSNTITAHLSFNSQLPLVYAYMLLVMICVLMRVVVYTIHALKKSANTGFPPSRE